jgi:hypothetical protein
MLPLLLVLALSLLLALVCSAIPWLARLLRGWSLAIGLVVGSAVSLIGVVLPRPLSRWTGFVVPLGVLVVAWSGGLLVGRWIPARFRPFLLSFLCLSALDVLLTAGLSASPPHTPVGSAPLRVGDFLLVLPWGRFETNVVDLLLITALAEHWRRRGMNYLIALLPSALGFLLADGFVLVTRLGIVPGIPFLTAGYLCSEEVYRYLSRHRGPAPANTAR